MLDVSSWSRGGLTNGRARSRARGEECGQDPASDVRPRRRERWVTGPRSDRQVLQEVWSYVTGWRVTGAGASAMQSAWA